jgi:hypothetical protein
VLLCSDGLSDYVTHESLVTSLVDGSPLDAARSLLRGALRAGTRDNVTVIVADVHDPDLERDADFVPEPAVVVGASLGQAQLDGGARAVLLDAFPDAATLLDTVPRVPTDEIDEDTLPPRGATASRSTAEERDGEERDDATVPPEEDTDGDGDASPTPDVADTVPVATWRDVTETVPVPPPAAEPGRAGDAPAPARDAEGLEALFGPSAASPVPAAATAASSSAAAADPAGDQGDQEDRDEAGDADPVPPAARTSNRPDARDVLWLGLVVASFTAVTLSVWFTQS